MRKQGQIDAKDLVTIKLTESFLMSLSTSIFVTVSLTLSARDRAIRPAVLISFSRKSSRNSCRLSATYSAKATEPEKRRKCQLVTTSLCKTNISYKILSCVCFTMSSTVYISLSDVCELIKKLVLVSMTLMNVHVLTHQLCFSQILNFPV